MRILVYWLAGLIVLVAPVSAEPPKSEPAAPPSSQARADLVIAEGLGSKNPDTRKLAVVALGLIGPRQPYLTQLESMLNDKDVYVRVAVVTSLVDLENPRTVTLLKRALNDDAPEVTFAAAKALWTLKDPEGRRVLLSVLSGETRTSSGAFDGKKRDMLRMFHTPKTMFMFVMKEGIGMAPIPGLGAGVSSLQELLADSSTSGRAATALLLASDTSPEVQSALRSALSDKNASVRAAAVHALAMRNDPALTPAVLPLLGDENEGVRLRAAAAYLRLAFLPKAVRKNLVTRRGASRKNNRAIQK